MLKALPDLHAAKSFGLWYYTVALLILYIPMGPFMIMNMNGQRVKANKNRAEALLKSPKFEAGILFPVDKSKVNRTTSPAGQNAFAATFSAIGNDLQATKCLSGLWRFSYNKHLLQHVKCSLESKGNAVAMAKAGIDFIYQNFEFGAKADGESTAREGKVVKLLEALKSDKQPFNTHIVQGKADLPRKVTVPYAKYPKPRIQQEKLEGERLKQQLKHWAERGTIEPDTATSLTWAIDNEAKIDLSSHWFVLLGANSAMGPLPFLLAHGANIVAVDVRDWKVKGETRSAWWQKSGNGILNKAENSAGMQRTARPAILNHTLTPVRALLRAVMEANRRRQLGEKFFAECGRKRWRRPHNAAC
jgi:hypothetical protein